MKPVTQKLQKFINSISTIGDSNISDDDGKIYYSNFDNSYLSRVGMENSLKYLMKLGISEQIQTTGGLPGSSCLGFNPTEKLWYGWSHRAISGFGINSTCKKGDCGYSAPDITDYIDECIAFWCDGKYSIGDENGELTTRDGEAGVLVSYTYNDKVPNKALIGTTYTHFSILPEAFGRGEWIANTLEDAKLMASEFAEGVS